MARAKKHLAAFRDERERFLDGADSRIVSKFEPSTGEYFVRMGGDPPDPGIGLIVSDYLHQLRAALDNLVRELVVLNNGTVTTKTIFPIFEDEAVFRKEPRRHTNGMRGEHHTIIEGTQPFQERRYEGETAHRVHPLNVLRLLNDHDKHRYLHTVTAATTYGEVSGNGPVRILPNRIELFMEGFQFSEGGSVILQSMPEIPTPFPRQGRLDSYTVGRNLRGETDDSTELLYARIIDGGTDPLVEVKPPITVDIAIGHPESRFKIGPRDPVWATNFDLSHMGSLVEAVIDTFVSEF